MPTSENEMLSFNARIEEDLANCKITGIEVLNDGRILICDSNNNKVKLFQFDGSFLCFITLKSLPIDLTAVSQTRIVFTNDIGNKLSLLNVVGDKLFLERDIAVKSGATGVCAVDNSIILTYPWESPPEIVTIDSDGRVIKTFIKNAKKKPLFKEHPISICAFSDQIYVCCMSFDGKRDKIHKLSTNGDILATYQHPDLKCARYINLDMFGNLYVCSLLSSCVIRFDRSSSVGRVIFSSKDDIKLPCALGILDQSLYIAQEGQDTIHIMTIESFSENYNTPVEIRNRKPVPFSIKG